MTSWEARKSGFILLFLCGLGISNFLPAQPIIKGPFASQDILIQDTDEVRLIAYPEHAESYRWSTGWKTPVIFIQDSGWVWVEVQVDGNVTRDSIHFRLPIPCVAVPHTFTPNDDGTDDCLKIEVHCILEGFSLTYFDRWGQKVFETIDPKQCWDGTNNGAFLTNGVYYYTLNYRVGSQDQQNMKGFTTLLR